MQSIWCACGLAVSLTSHDHGLIKCPVADAVQRRWAIHRISVPHREVPQVLWRLFPHVRHHLQIVGDVLLAELLHVVGRLALETR